MFARRFPLILTLVGLVAVLGMAGCCSLGLRSCSTTDELVFTAKEDLNNCNNVASSLVAVRVFYLADKDEFSRAKVEELWRDSPGALGQSLLDSKQYNIIPGARSTQNLVRPAGAAYLGILADFCRDEGTSREVVALDDGGVKKTIVLQGMRLTVLGQQ